MNRTTNLHRHADPTVVDRRRCPDRRAMWRGGRRDSDWTNRPAGALAAFEAPFFSTVDRGQALRAGYR